MILLAELVPGVRPTGESLVFEVQSASRPRLWHRVDFAAYSGFGACSCERFTRTLSRKIRKMAPAPPGLREECPHLPRARRYLAILVAQRIIQQRSRQPDPKMSRSEWENPGF